MKSHKIAHIVPVHHLEITRDNQYHMCLAHLVLQNASYAAFYRRMVVEGKFVLMDNGAAEHSQLSKEQLLEAYRMIQPTELVLLDALSDRRETYRRTVESLEFFKANGVTCQFMAVPQGINLAEWVMSAMELLMIPEVGSIGVSKFLNITTNNPNVRYDACKYLQPIINGKEVHLLGCDAGAYEVRAIFDQFDFVRGNDTALAYLHAQANAPLTMTSTRPAGEIDFLKGIVPHIALVDATSAFESLASVYNRADSTWR